MNKWKDGDDDVLTYTNNNDNNNIIYLIDTCFPCGFNCSSHYLLLLLAFFLSLFLFIRKYVFHWTFNNKRNGKKWWDFVDLRLKIIGKGKEEILYLAINTRVSVCEMRIIRKRRRSKRVFVLWLSVISIFMSLSPVSTTKTKHNPMIPSSKKLYNRTCSDRSRCSRGTSLLPHMA